MTKALNKTYSFPKNILLRFFEPSSILKLLGKNSLSYLYFLETLAISALFFKSSNRSATVLLQCSAFVFFTWLSEIWRFNKTRRYTLGITGFTFLIIAMHTNHIGFIQLVPFAFYMPIIAIYTFKDYITPNIISITTAVILYMNRGEILPNDAFGYALGMMSSSVSYLIIAYLIRRLRQERDKYHQLSITDALTGLPTLSHIMEIGQTLLDKNSELSVLLVDLDNFKRLNDTYGHLVGNKAIIHSAKLLREGLKAYKSTLGRLGGDEFVILIENPLRDGGEALIEELHKVFNDNPFYADPDIPAIRLFCSIGIAQSTKGITNKIETLLNSADTMMYQNKYGNYKLEISVHSEQSLLPGRCIDILNTLKEKDMYTYIHSRYTAQYAAALGKALKLDQNYIDDLYVAGWLHDIGKLFISSDILRKPSKLNDWEYSIIKMHPAEGSNTLNIFNVSQRVKNAVKYHHERWDGSGYSAGLCGEDIPLEARIMSIADVFSAITIKRIYRQSLETEAALIEIERSSGTQFDPNLVKVFSNLINSKLQPEQEKYVAVN